MATPVKRNLVVCRIGDASLHREWLGDPATRSYDVWLDCYGGDPDRWAGDAALVSVRRNVPKWPGIAALLRERADEAARYEAVWLPDDDLRVDAAGVERLFDTFHALGLSLAQPALAEGSHWIHLVTVQSRAFTVRYTNFVEVMAPLFSREALRACSPTFEESVSGYGLDLVWPVILGSPRDRIGIVDAAPVVHTRPPGRGDWYRRLEVTPGDENARLAARYRVALPFTMREYGAVARSGARVGPGLGFLARLALGAPPSLARRGRFWKGHARMLRAGRTR